MKTELPATPLTIQLHATQVRDQFSAVVDQVHQHGVIVIILHRRRPQAAIVPLGIAQGRGITIGKRGKPVAALVGVRVQEGPDG